MKTTSTTTQEELIHQAVLLARQGMSRRAIARALDISRNTVRKLFEAHDLARVQPHQAITKKRRRSAQPNKLADYVARIAELLERYPNITAQRVFEEVRTAGYSGGYTVIKKHVRVVRPKPKATPSLQTPTYGPGKMAESDWSPHTITWTTGHKTVVQVFAYVLCHSHRKSFGLYERSDFFALLDGHVNAFAYFTGVAHGCKYDCQKAVVLGWEGSQPIYNPRFIAFAAHYEFRPRACRPRHPNDKPVVERAFWEFERSFLNGRSFRDLTDMRQQLQAWQRDICDTRLHKRSKRSALDMFAEEQPHLIKLPSHPYDTARVVHRVCDLEGFISWDGNRYAVPYENVTDIVPVRVTQHELFVYAADLRCIARHALAPKSAGLDIDPQQIHAPSRRRSPIDMDRLRRIFEDIGPQAEQFFAALIRTQDRFAGHHARQILLLRERYNTVSLLAAMQHAQNFGAYDHHAVARILAARAAPRSLAEYVAEDTARKLDAEIGHADSLARDLDEYDRLPLATSTTNSESTCSEPTQSPRTNSSSDCDDTSTS